MKTSFLLFIFGLLVSNTSRSSTLLQEPHVDERVELLSIVFRLAECDEYNSTRNKVYVERIHAHFDTYKNHDLIRYIKKIRRRGIGFDAVMQMAVHIGEAPLFKPLVRFDKNKPEARWGKKVSLRFLKLLRSFYVDARCEQFFEKERPYYKEVAAAFLPNYKKLDLNWYTEFYKTEPKEKFIVIIAPGNGGNNYGPHLLNEKGEKENYAIMGSWNFDEQGNCLFPIDDYFPILLHEFNHSFVNPLLHDYKQDLETSCSQLFKALEIEMRNQAYGDWEVMFNESVVRAAVIQYMLDHNFESETIEEERKEQFYRGFLWTDDLVTSLNRFASNRLEYRAFKDYMPEIVTDFNRFQQKLPAYLEAFDKDRPRVLSINEFENQSASVNAALKTITINFDREMRAPAYSINYGRLGKKHYPQMNTIRYSEDKKAVILEVALECDQDYQLILMSRGFLSKERVPIKDYEIRFRTSKCIE